MKNIISFAGLIGAVLLTFGCLSGLADDSYSQPLVVAHLIIGATLVLVWLALLGAKKLPLLAGIFSSRQARYSYFAVSYGIVFLLLAIALNFIAAKYNLRWDLTQNKVYSLAPQTEQVLAQLEQPLKIVALADQRKYRDLLNLYQQQNSLLQVEYADPLSQPQLVERYQIRAGNLLYLAYGTESANLAQRLNSIDEESLTNAILSLVSNEQHKIYYLTGQQQPDLSATDARGLKKVLQALQTERYAVAALDLNQNSVIPADARAILLVSAKIDLSAEAKQALIGYLERGGSLLLLSDPRAANSLKEIALQFGINIGQNVVLDRKQTTSGATTFAAQPVLSLITEHPIAEAFAEANQVVFPLASTVSVDSGFINRPGYAILAQSSESAWAETDLNQLLDKSPPQAAKDSAEAGGPLSLAVTYQREIAPEKFLRLVVFGDSDWLINANFDVYRHRDLLLNSLAWAAGETKKISIRPRSFTPTLRPLPRQAMIKILLASLLLPELVLLLGLCLWWYRRQLPEANPA